MEFEVAKMAKFGKLGAREKKRQREEAQATIALELAQSLAEFQTAHLQDEILRHIMNISWESEN